MEIIKTNNDIQTELSKAMKHIEKLETLLSQVNTENCNRITVSDRIKIERVLSGLKGGN